MFVVMIGLSSKKLYSFITTLSNSSPSFTSFLIPEIISLASSSLSFLSLLLSSSSSSSSLSPSFSSSNSIFDFLSFLSFFSLLSFFSSFLSILTCGKFLQCKKAFDEIIFFSLFLSVTDNSTWQEPPYNNLDTLVEHIVPINFSFSDTFSTFNFLILDKLDKLANFLFSDKCITLTMIFFSFFSLCKWSANIVPKLVPNDTSTPFTKFLITSALNRNPGLNKLKSMAFIGK